MNYTVNAYHETNWVSTYRSALFTEGKDSCNVPSDEWIRKILHCQHSPIRCKWYWVEMIGIPYWVSVHLVRHKHGVEHFVSTQRTDRTGVSRDELPQNAPVNHAMHINAEALINISRKRMCGKASHETIGVWLSVYGAIQKIDPIMAEFMQPECSYRGGVCHEMKSCGSAPHYSEVK